MVVTRISGLLEKITVFVVFCCCCLPAQAKYGGGSGTSDDPYLIYNAGQMNAIGADSNDWDRHFKLMADVNLAAFTGTQYNIIGYYVSSSDNKPFKGTFDGNGYAVLNFNFTSTGLCFVGLFGYVDDPNAEIEDLGLIDPNIDVDGAWRIGPLVGWLSTGTITNCWVDGGRFSGVDGVGGLVGRNAGTITDCSSSASVSGAFGIGGLVGINDGKITGCYSSGDVCGFSSVGGLVGFNGGTISNCYSDVNVSEIQVMGGLVGQNEGTITNCYSGGDVSGCMVNGGLVGANSGTITNCYAATSVSGTHDLGGLVGQHNGGTISNCYSIGSVDGEGRLGGLVGSGSPDYVLNSFWDIESSGQASSVGGKGKKTAEMQMQFTFTDAGWDFIKLWDIGENQTYPYLRTGPASDINKDGITNFLDFAVIAQKWMQGK